MFVLYHEKTEAWRSQVTCYSSQLIDLEPGLEPRPTSEMNSWRPLVQTGTQIHLAYSVFVKNILMNANIKNVYTKKCKFATLLGTHIWLCWEIAEGHSSWHGGGGAPF